MTLEQRVEYLEKEVEELKKQLEDYQKSTSCLVDSLRSGIHSALVSVAEQK